MESDRRRRRRVRRLATWGKEGCATSFEKPSVCEDDDWLWESSCDGSRWFEQLGRKKVTTSSPVYFERSEERGDKQDDGVQSRRHVRILSSCLSLSFMRKHREERKGATKEKKRKQYQVCVLSAPWIESVLPSLLYSSLLDNPVHAHTHYKSSLFSSLLPFFLFTRAVKLEHKKE